MKMPQPDPIIAEVWAVRDQHAARFDYDIKAFPETFKPSNRLLVASTSAIPHAAQSLSQRFGQSGEVGWAKVAIFLIGRIG